MLKYADNFELSEYPSVPHRPPQFNTSVPLMDHTFSAPKIPQFHTKNPSVPHQKPLSSTRKPPQFHTKNPSVPSPQFHTKNPSVQYSFSLRDVWNWVVFSEAFFVLNWGILGVELRGFWCWTEGFLLWKWGVFGVGLRDFEVEKEWPFCVELMCWTQGGPT